MKIPAEKKSPLHPVFLILILGSLTALSPFSIDMYLPAFPEIARDFGSTVARVSLSLSSYFVGLSLGQLFYGPLLDRFGRKPPLYAGLILYILASSACLFSKSIEGLVLLRFFQALGGCAAGVASMAMVRDLFSVRESAKIISLLILVLGVSPMLAPTVGGYLSSAFGWHSVFIALIGIAATVLLVVRFRLPESHGGDPSVSLRVGPIFKTFAHILRNPQFSTYTFSGAIAFSGLFAYLAGSPVIFMDIFQVGPKVYGWIFAGISVGIIGSSQFNVHLLKRFTSERIFATALFAQVAVSLLLLAGTAIGFLELKGTVVFFFLMLSCLGITNPNAAALGLAPFARNAGSAAALMGFLQMGAGAFTSMIVSLLPGKDRLPIVAIMAAASCTSLVVFTLGKRRIRRTVEANPDGPAIGAH